LGELGFRPAIAMTLALITNPRDNIRENVLRYIEGFFILLLANGSNGYNFN
jgi:hypothetical protein